MAGNGLLVQRLGAAGLGHALRGQVGRQFVGGKRGVGHRGNAPGVQAKLLVGVGGVAQLHRLARMHKTGGAAGSVELGLCAGRGGVCVIELVLQLALHLDVGHKALGCQLLVALHTGLAEGDAAFQQDDFIDGLAQLGGLGLLDLGAKQRQKQGSQPTAGCKVACVFALNLRIQTVGKFVTYDQDRTYQVTLCFFE